MEYHAALNDVLNLIRQIPDWKANDDIRNLFFEIGELAVAKENEKDV